MSAGWMDLLAILLETFELCLLVMQMMNSLSFLFWPNVFDLFVQCDGGDFCSFKTKYFCSCCCKSRFSFFVVVTLLLLLFPLFFCFNYIV